MPVQTNDNKSKEEILSSRDEFKRAIERLERFAKMSGCRLNEPSLIVKRSTHGQWRAEPLIRNRRTSHSTSRHGRAK